MAQRVYRQSWSDGSKSLHKHPADIQAFGYQFFKANPLAKIEMIGNSVETTTNLDMSAQYGRWEK